MMLRIRRGKNIFWAFHSRAAGGVGPYGAYFRLLFSQLFCNILNYSTLIM